MNLDAALRIASAQINFQSVPCEVIEIRSWSETHVFSHGGGGVITSGSGIINAPTVSSIVLDRSEVWLRDEAGREFCIKPDKMVSCRPGHRLKLLFAAANGSATGHYVAACNEATRHYSELWLDYSWFLGECGVLKTWIPSFLISIVSFGTMVPLLSVPAPSLQQWLDNLGLASNLNKYAIGGAVFGAIVGGLYGRVYAWLLNSSRDSALRERIRLLCSSLLNSPQ